MHATETIKILIADDHPILRQTLSTYLTHESEVQVVGEVGDTHTLLEEARLLQPNILLLDVNMPGPNILSTIAALRVHCPEARILVLSASKERKQVLELLKAGVKGYVLKEDNPRELLQAIHSVANGEEWFSTKITKVLVNSIRDNDKKEQINLTKREKDVLELMVTGASNDEIAAQLFIATNTVKNHVRSIFRKLNAETRVEAIVIALQHHLIEGGLD